MHSRLLSYFMAVYESESVSTAAERLHITQPALTKSIQQLEEALSIKLFDRRPRGITRTHYADILARRVRFMETEYRHALAEIQVARGGSEGLIRLGAGPVWYSNLLPPVMADFTSQWPGARFRVQSGVIDTLLPGLKSGRYDLICTSIDFQPQSDIFTEPLLDIEHCIVAREHHPLAGLSKLPASALSDYPWVVLAEDAVGTGRALAYFDRYSAAPPRFAVETSSSVNMFETIRQSDMLGQLPRLMSDHARKFGLVKLDLEGVFWNTTGGIAYRSNEQRTPMLNRFLAAMRKAQFKAAG